MAGTLFENNLSPYLTIVETTEPSAPSAGQQRVYIDSTSHQLSATNSSGTERNIETGEFATQVNKVATAENTTSGSFADLSTPGPSITLTVGPSGKVKLSLACNAFNTSATENYVGIVISGANTVAAATYLNLPTTASHNAMAGRTTLLTGLSAGSTTFKMQYAVLAGTGTFSVRELIAESVR